MTPEQLIKAWALRAGASPEVIQEDDGSGYSVIAMVTEYGEFNVTVDAEFVNVPQAWGEEDVKPKPGGGFDISDAAAEEVLRLSE